MKSICSQSVIAVVALLLAMNMTSCKKKDYTASAMPCGTIVYSYVMPTGSPAYGPYLPHSFGVLNLTSGASSATANVNARDLNNQGAYNSLDNSYYTLTDTNIRFAVLCKVDPTGSVSYYNLPAGDTSYMYALCYNIYSHKLLAVNTSAATSTLDEITVGTGGSFTHTPIATLGASAATYGYTISTTANPSNGDVYVGINSGSFPGAYSIQKVATGASAGTVIASASGSYIGGVRYNMADNMLYAIRVNNAVSPATYDLVKTANTTSTPVLVCNLSFPVNVDFYSTCIDPCSNEYIISTVKYNGGSWALDSGKIYQLDITTGALLQTNTTAGVHEGLDVRL